MTQTECAARAGVKLQQWNRMEKTVEQPRISTLELVARGLEMPLRDVLAATMPALVETITGADDDLLRLKSVLDRLPPIKRRQSINDFVSLLSP